MNSVHSATRKYDAIAVASVLLFLSACATTSSPPARFCDSPSMLVDANFEGGNFYSCSVENNTDVSILIRPEDEPPINQSPWYSLRLSPKQPTTATLHFRFNNGYARYWPKISGDGENFTPIAAHAVVISDDGAEMTVTVPLAQNQVWISAQELLLPTYYAKWLREMNGHPEITTRILGRSVEGRPIHVAETAPRAEVIYLIGRQHPPEVTGAFAMRSFVDTVLSDTELARSFRQRFSIIIVPLINPDGVVHGHWRHNMNGVDLNRDWGTFTQPETQSVERLLQTMEASNKAPRLMLDFHSTRDSLFYTQLAGDFDEPVDFATAWLNNSRARLPDFIFKHDPRGPSGQANTKNYFFSRYRIPAITYEIGDEVSRDDIRSSTPVFAEEMMRELMRR